MDERESERTRDLRFTAPEPPASDTLPLAPPSAGGAGAPPPGAPPSVVPHPYAPHPYAPGPTPYGAPGGPPAPTNSQATASLVLGIASLFLGLLFVPSILGVVLGIVGLARSGRTSPPTGRGAAITGIVLSVVGAALGVVTAVTVSNLVSDTARTIVEDAASAAPEASAGPDLDEFVAVDAAEWESVVKHPGRAEGRAVVVYAEVARFDGTTGDDRFLGGVGVDQPGSERELEDPAVVVGDVPLLDGVETGDVLRIHAVVTGSLELDTQLGGLSEVPVLTVAQVEDVGFVDLREDLAVGTPEEVQPGWFSLPVTVTNTGSRPFTYSATVTAESKDGEETYGKGTVYVEKIGAGKKEKTTVDFFDEVPVDAVFRVESVERYAE
ncbi:hypothetical protein GCM10010413_17920 [Promicromonospora sukumoe]|uniref:DUF4190 domain-containing protein n=1 Tax=Promicromonospora sukumoe TaxID=88382 RepID=A0A7W3JA69_9MICO|nr:DUF4190 domain-containing protein [Promicromonospora sukumoe]MBA8808989.1 hypothetical protein [Promicromonospora sukumoe]